VPAARVNDDERAKNSDNDSAEEDAGAVVQGQQVQGRKRQRPRLSLSGEDVAAAVQADDSGAESSHDRLQSATLQVDFGEVMSIWHACYVSTIFAS